MRKNRAYILVIVFLTSMVVTDWVRAYYNRQMLNARGEIQIMLIKTGLRRGAFTEEEKQFISSRWNAAEYSEVEGNPFK